MDRDLARNPRRVARRCMNCGKQLPFRNGRPARTCPTCGSVQEEVREDPLLLGRNRVPSHEFYGANLVGIIIGAVIGLPLGAVFGVVVSHGQGALERFFLAILFALGFAFICACFGFMAVGRGDYRRDNRRNR